MHLQNDEQHLVRNSSKQANKAIGINMKFITLLFISLLVGGCATSSSNSLPLTRYDKDTEYRIDDAPDGFGISVSYSRYQFIPNSSAVASECRSALSAVAVKYAEKMKKAIDPVNEQAIATSISRKFLSGISVCLADTVVKWNNSVLSDQSMAAVVPKEFEKSIPRKPGKEDRPGEDSLDKIPSSWPQRYYYETDEFRYWTICGEVVQSQSEAVISSKNKADEVFYSEFPQSRYGNLSYETTHMEINSAGNKYKSWRIIRAPRSFAQ